MSVNKRLEGLEILKCTERLYKGNLPLIERDMVRELKELYPTMKSDYYNDTFQGNLSINEDLNLKAWITVYANDNKIDKEIHKYYIYSWPGSGYLISKLVIPFNILSDIYHAKKSELEEAKIKRRKQIKRPTDFIKILFQENDISQSPCPHGIRHLIVYKEANASPMALEFINTETHISVQLTFKNMLSRSSYQTSVEIDTLTLADPQIEEKVFALIKNWDNMINIIRNAQ